ncbi:MAG: hypothetical protein HZC51_07265 [Nitrospirae bacterium]|nr:hypothetical protein [Nitrospirota bacterium]
MRSVLLAVVLVVFVLSGVPAFANGGDETDGRLNSAMLAKAGVLNEAAHFAEDSVTCARCGMEFAAGRHGQPAGAVPCPSCGNEDGAEREGSGFSFGADMGVLNKYVSRGLTYSEDPVFQPNVWGSYYGLTLNVWANLDLTDYNGMAGGFYEVDYGLDYTGEAGGLEYSAGALYYSYPRMDDAETVEIYAGLGLDAPLHPKLNLYYDCWRGDGFYGVFSVEHCVGLPSVLGCKTELGLAAQVGLGSKNYNVYSYGSDHTAFTDYVLTASLPVEVTENISVTPSVSYSSALDRTIRSKIDNDDAVIAGFVVSARF